MAGRETIILIDNSIAVTGAFKCALQQAKLLREDFNYIFLLPRNSVATPFAQAEGFKVYEVDFREIRKNFFSLISYLPKLFSNTATVRSIIKKENVSIVVVNDFYNLIGAALKMRNVPIKLVTYIRLLPNRIPSPLRKLWVGAALKYSDLIIPVSDAVKDQLPSHLKIKRIYDPVSFPENHQAYELFESSPVKFLYLSNYIRGKGQDIGLRAFGEAYKLNKDIRLVFAGGDMGLEKNKLFRKELEDEVKSTGLEEAVSFLPFVDDIELLIKQHQVLLNCSESESFSMTCAEASFYGLPVITTNSGGPAEIVQHNHSGLVVENKNAEAIKNAILQLADSAELRKQFSDAGKIYVRSKFSMPVFLDTMKKELAKLVNRNL